MKPSKRRPSDTNDKFILNVARGSKITEIGKEIHKILISDSNVQRIDSFTTSDIDGSDSYPIESILITDSTIGYFKTHVKNGLIKSSDIYNINKVRVEEQLVISNCKIKRLVQPGLELMNRKSKVYIVDSTIDVIDSGGIVLEGGVLFLKNVLIRRFTDRISFHGSIKTLNVSTLNPDTNEYQKIVNSISRNEEMIMDEEINSSDFLSKLTVEDTSQNRRYAKALIIFGSFLTATVMIALFCCFYAEHR